MGIAALIMGIFAIILGFFPVIFWIPLCLGIAAVILGAIGKKKGMPCATGGLVVGIIGLAVTLICLWLCAEATDAVDQAMDIVDSYY